jgi:hypothetical protein
MNCGSRIFFFRIILNPAPDPVPDPTTKNDPTVLKQVLRFSYGKGRYLRYQGQINMIIDSVADPDPRSGAILTPGSGIRDG